MDGALTPPPLNVACSALDLCEELNDNHESFSPLVGEMPGRAEGGAAPADTHEHDDSKRQRHP
jgi:hypothetical protein